MRARGDKFWSGFSQRPAAHIMTHREYSTSDQGGVRRTFPLVVIWIVLAEISVLIVWLGAILLFGIGVALHGLWLAVATDAIISMVVAAFAIRGARW